GLDRDGPRAPAAREDRARSRGTGVPRDRVGRRLSARAGARMMLDAGAFAQIALTALACTAVVSALAFLLLRRGFGLATGLAVLVAAAIASIVCSALAVAGEMYLSDHDVVV